MENNINPIKIGLAGNKFPPKETPQETKDNGSKASVLPQNQAEVSANDVLSYMATVNNDLIPKSTVKTVDVSKYVTPEQKERIEGFVQGFENSVNEMSSAAMAEFPDLSPEAADAVALAFVNASY